MRIVIGNSHALTMISSSVTDVHITFRPSEKEIFQLITNCPDLKSIQIPVSHMKSISNTTKSILRLRGVALSEGSVHNAERYIG